MFKKKVRIVTVLLAVIMMMGLVGCGVSVGSTPKNDDHKQLFPDKTYSGAYKTTNLGYQFKLTGDYGKMMVYVDTTEGHSFELMQEPTGFKIKDKDGNDVLYAVCLDRDVYAEYSAKCDEVKTVNGRDFLYCKNGDGSEDCYTYVADCGLDCGLALEIHDGDFDHFRLVAFRGEPLEGASTDVYYYQGEKAAVEPEVIDEPDEPEVIDEPANTGDIDTNTLVNSTLSADVEKAITSLTTDYNKVCWGSRYSPFADKPGVVISVTPCTVFGDEYGLIVAVTNLYDEDISFAGSGSALGRSGNVLGDTYIYNPCIGSGNTIIDVIACGTEEMPDGRIHWEDLDLSEAIGKYVPWEADYSGSGNGKDGLININYEMYATYGTPCNGEAIYAVLLDENGFAVGVASDYASSIGANEKYSGKIGISGNPDELMLAKGVAMFANPTEE